MLSLVKDTPMNIEEYKSSFKNTDPPQGLSVLLLALWYDAKGNWTKSHDIISAIETKDASLVHAYLHRKEGDLWNADYWYSRANAKRPETNFTEEWNALVRRFLSTD